MADWKDESAELRALVGRKIWVKRGTVLRDSLTNARLSILKRDLRAVVVDGMVGVPPNPACPQGLSQAVIWWSKEYDTTILTPIENIEVIE